MRVGTSEQTARDQNAVGLSERRRVHMKKGELTLVGEGPLAVLLVHHGQGIGVDELGCGQEVGVECIHVRVQPVVVLEVAVIVLCKRARHVLGHVMHVLYPIEHIQLWQLLHHQVPVIDAARAVDSSCEMLFDGIEEFLLGEVNIPVVVPHNDLLDVRVPHQVCNNQLQVIDPFPAQ